ncbi:unnamed protein product [Prunus armeniaca]
MATDQSDSTEKFNKSTNPESGEGSNRPIIQITIPKKVQRASSAIEEEEADNMSEDDNHDWLDYELNHEEFKSALGLQAKDEDSQALVESQPDHMPAIMFGTIEEVGESTVGKPILAIEKSETLQKPMKTEVEVEPSMNQAIKCREKTTAQGTMPVYMVYVLPAFYRSKEGQPCSMEGDILIEEHVAALIGIHDDYDDKPSAPQTTDSGLKYKGLDSPKKETPRVFFTRPTRSMTRHLRPLFISARINGVPFKKVLIDGGAAVNILPFKRLEKFGKSKSDLIPTELTVSNFTGTITATHGILIAEFEVGLKNLLVSYLVVDSTSSYHALMDRDWIHQSMSIPSSLQHELLMWDEEIEDYEMVKADSKPFLPSAKYVPRDKNLAANEMAQIASGIQIQENQPERTIIVQKRALPSILSGGLDP